MEPTVSTSTAELAAAPSMEARQQSAGVVWALLAMCFYAVLVATFFIARSGSHWAENDSADLALAIRGLLTSGRLVTDTGDVYQNGFGYTALAAFLSQFTGLSVATLQQIVFPLLSASLVLPAYALYREITGSRQVAVLSTILLFVQPEFLFVILRGSHERMLRTLMFVAIWLLMRSLRLRENPRAFALHVVLFYLTTFGIIATNALFGISFATAIAVAMAVAWAVGRWRPSLLTIARLASGRLASVATAVTALGLVFIFYIYTPASRSLAQLHDVGRTSTLLFFSTNSTSSSTAAVAVNPYSQVVG
ncbi:MAG: hypothetical protein JOZ39_03950, partial [Chloroflexi bacterium]|nr:hypothetical protein [Chloroflexota bacterium]